MVRTSLSKCSEIRKLLPDYLNGALDLEAAQQMRLHLGHCHDCRMIVQSAIDTFRHFYPEKRAEYHRHKSHAA
jgi:predicted anti-sigma-YlaC factor YlaD